VQEHRHSREHNIKVVLIGQQLLTVLSKANRGSARLVRGMAELLLI
jgi:hypothetical protein